MKLWIMIAAATAMTLSNGMLPAETTTTPATAPATQPAAAKTIRGLLKDVGTGDRPDITLTISGTARNVPPKDVVIHTTALTIVTGNGNKKTVKELEPGQRISVKLDEKGENALSIFVIKLPRPQVGGGPEPFDPAPPNAR